MGSRFTLSASIALAVACVVTAPRLAWSQSANAVITGNVVDDSGGVLPGATVTATSNETGLARTVVTGQRGAYQFNSLPPGTYTVKVEMSGFATQTHPPIVLAIGQTATLNFSMKVASVSESVLVTAEAPVVDVTKSTVQTSIAPRDVDNLPLIGRQFMDLADLAPGVSIDNSSANASSDNVSFAGFGEGYKSIWLEGMDVNDEETNGGTGLSNASRFNFPLEAVQEFQVLSNTYSAEFGRSATGAINILTKSGTNTFHGRGFYFIRDHAFQKPNALARGNPPFREQQSGATLGGPIRENRLWFFATYENQTLNDVVTVKVPAFVLPIVPDASTNVQQPTRENTLFSKVTASLGRNNYLNVVGLYGHDSFQNQDVGGTTAADSGDNKLQVDKMVSGSLTSVFRNDVTNDLRFAVSDGLKSRPPNAELAPQVSFPSITFGTHTNFFQGRDQKNYTLMDTLNLHHEGGFGTHDVKVGGMINKVREIDTLEDTFHGSFTFLRDQLPVPGVPGTYPVLFEIRTGNPTLDLSPMIYAAFAEDAWRPRANLTITAGVRYDYDRFADNNGAALPDIPVNQFLMRYMRGDLSGNVYETAPTDPNDVGPRLSVAWDPKGDATTVVRAGAGLFYDRLLDTTRGSIIRGYPNGPVQTFANDVRVTGIPNTFFPNIPDLSQLRSVGSTSVRVPNPAGGHTPFTKQFTAGVERQLGRTNSVSVDYIRMRGQHFPMQYNINARRADGTYPIDPSGIVMTILDPSNVVHSDQVQVTFRQRLSHRVSFQTSYGYLRFFQYQSDPVNKANIFQNNWGPGPNDVRHRFVFSGTYDLPYRIELSGIVNATSAPPYTVITGVDNNADRDVNDRPVVDGVMVPPNSARGDTFFRTDLRVGRQFELRSGERLEVLWEMNNVFNTVNYGGYIGNMRSVNFGLPSYALTPFQGQLGVRFTF